MQTAFKVGGVVQADCNSDAAYIFEGRAYPSSCSAGKTRDIGGPTFQFDKLQVSGLRIPGLDVLNAARRQGHERCTIPKLDPGANFAEAYGFIACQTSWRSECAPNSPLV